MELIEYLKIALKRKWIILAITLIATILSGVVTVFVIDKTYNADISVIIGQDPQLNSDNPKQSVNDIMMYKQMVKTYSEFSKSRKVLDDVINKLDLDISASDLLGKISVAPKADTEFLTISVKDKDPNMAKKIANQMAISLKEISKTVKKVDNVQILDEAQFPKGPSSPKTLMNIAIAFVLGLMISIGVVFLMEYLDDTIKTEEDIEQLIGVPVLGTIPLMKE